MSFVLGIDGYSKTGKTTLARNLSKEYNAPILDVGILYRTIASLLINHNFSEEQTKYIVNSYSLEDIMKALGVYYNYELKTFEPILDNLYNVNTTTLGALIGAETGDKWYYNFNSIVRKLNKENNVIVVGRNLLKIFPNLDVHIFLTANINKILELTLKEQPNLTKEETLKYIQQREEKEKIIRKYFIQNKKTKFIDVSKKNETDVFSLVEKEIKSSLHTLNTMQSSDQLIL